MEHAIDLKVPESRKTSDWYKKIFNYYVPATNVVTYDFRRLKRLYEFMGGDLRGFDNYARDFSDVITFTNDSDNLIHFSKLFNKVNILKEDVMDYANSFTIASLSEAALDLKNKELQGVLESKALEFIQRVQLLNPNLTKEQLTMQVEQIINEISPSDISLKDFKSSLEGVLDNLLRYGLRKQKVSSILSDGVHDAFVSGRFFIRNTHRNGEPCIDVINALTSGFVKSHNEADIKYCDAFFFHDYITVSTLYSEYSDDLSKEDLELLASSALKSANTSGWQGDQNYLYNSTSHFDLLRLYGVDNPADRTGLSFGLSQNPDSHDGRLRHMVKRTTLEFKAYKKVAIYRRPDAYGRMLKEFVDATVRLVPTTAQTIKRINDYGRNSTFKIWSDANGKEHSVEYIWVPRRYEVERLGDSVFTRMREVPYQPDNIQNPFLDYTSSFKGGVMLNRNSEPITPLEISLPYAFQIIYLKSLQNKEIAAYEGFQKIIDPERISDAFDDMDDGGSGAEPGQVDIISRSEAYARKTKTRFVTRSQDNLSGASQGAGISTIQIGSIAEIANIQVLINQIDQEMGIAIGVPSPREAQVDKYTPGNVLHQQLQQSKSTTQYINRFVLNIVSSALSEYMQFLVERVKFLLNSNQGSPMMYDYITHSGLANVMAITDETLPISEYGMYVTFSDADKAYLQLMMGQIQAIAQNSNESALVFSSIVKAVSSGATSDEIHQMIGKAVETMRANNQRNIDAQRNLLKEQEDKDRRLIEYKLELELIKEKAIEEERRLTRREYNEVELHKFRLANDVNQNNKSDLLEKAEMDNQVRLKLADDKNKIDLEIAKIKKQK